MRDMKSSTSIGAYLRRHALLFVGLHGPNAPSDTRRSDLVSGCHAGFSPMTFGTFFVASVVAPCIWTYRTCKTVQIREKQPKGKHREWRSWLPHREPEPSFGDWWRPLARPRRRLSCERRLSTIAPWSCLTWPGRRPLARRCRKIWSAKVSCQRLRRSLGLGERYHGEARSKKIFGCWAVLGVVYLFFAARGVGRGAPFSFSHPSLAAGGHPGIGSLD